MLRLNSLTKDHDFDISYRALTRDCQRFGKGHGCYKRTREEVAIIETGEMDSRLDPSNSSMKSD